MSEPEKKPEEAKPEQVKRSFVSEEDSKKTAEEKKEILKIPPAEITLMYVSKELREMNAKFDKLLAIFENATSQLKSQPTTMTTTTMTPNVVKTGVPTPEPKPAEAKVPEMSARLAEVKLKLGEFANMLNFDEQTSAQFIKVSPKQFLGAENFAKIATLIRTEFGGQYVSQGKHSHFLVPKQKA